MACLHTAERRTPGAARLDVTTLLSADADADRALLDAHGALRLCLLIRVCNAPFRTVPTADAKLRVGVEFAAPFGLLSLKHSNIAMADNGSARSKMLLAKYERKTKGPAA